MGVESLMMVAAFASAASTVAGGLNAYQTGRYNADVLNKQSKAARQEAGVNAQLALEQGARATGAGITIAAKAGGGYDGSARAVLEDLGRQNIYEARRITTEGVAISDAARAQAKMEIAQGNIALGTSVLDAGASLMGQRMQSQQRRQQARIAHSGQGPRPSSPTGFNRRRIDGLYGPRS